MGYNIKGDYYTHTYSNISPYNSKEKKLSCQYCGVAYGKSTTDVCLVLDEWIKSKCKKNGANKKLKARRRSHKSGKAGVKNNHKGN